MDLRVGLNRSPVDPEEEAEEAVLPVGEEAAADTGKNLEEEESRLLVGSGEDRIHPEERSGSGGSGSSDGGGGGGGVSPVVVGGVGGRGPAGPEPNSKKGLWLVGVKGVEEAEAEAAAAAAASLEAAERRAAAAAAR